jgi:hypothetical protein
MNATAPLSAAAELALLQTLLATLQPYRGTPFLERVLAYARDWAGERAPVAAARPVCNCEDHPYSRDDWGKAYCDECGARIPVLDDDRLVRAQHDETGRMWEGPANKVPRRFSVTSSDVQVTPKMRGDGAPLCATCDRPGLCGQFAIGYPCDPLPPVDSRETAATAVPAPSAEDRKSQEATRRVEALVMRPAAQGALDAAVEQMLAPRVIEVAKPDALARMVAQDQKRAGYSASGKKLGRPPRAPGVAAPPPKPARPVRAEDPKVVDRVLPAVADILKEQQSPMLADALLEALTAEGIVLNDDKPTVALAGMLFRSRQFVHGMGGWWFINEERPT